MKKIRVSVSALLLASCLSVGHAGAQVETLQERAARGNAAAQYELGMDYMQGRHGTRRDPGKGMPLLLKAAAQGHTDAEFRAGYFLLRSGEYEEALRWLRKAAGKLDQPGGTGAASEIAWMYANGVGVARDLGEAASWYRKAAERGDQASQLEHGWLQLEAGGALNFAESIKVLRRAAEQENLRARYSLVFIYAEGIHTRSDAAEAVYWLTRSRPSSDAEAAYQLGALYQRGLDGRDDRFVVDETSVLAHVLPHMGYSVSNFPKSKSQKWRDPERAFTWYRKAAEGGHVGAQISVGRIHSDPESPHWNCAEALKWTQAAADAGDPTALLELGRLYLKSPDLVEPEIGIGTEQTETGIKVREVHAGGAAERAGMRPGDLIIEVDGRSAVPLPRKGQEDWRQLLKFDDHAPVSAEALAWMVRLGQGQQISLRVRRDDVVHTARITPVEVVRKCPGGKESGLRLDRAEAVRWFEKAGEKGDAKGLYWAAEAYRRGDGVRKDPKNALALYKKGADLGDWWAAASLSEMYAKGEAVDRSQTRSEHWHREAVRLTRTRPPLHDGLPPH